VGLSLAVSVACNERPGDAKRPDRDVALGAGRAALSSGVSSPTGRTDARRSPEAAALWRRWQQSGVLRAAVSLPVPRAALEANATGRDGGVAASDDAALVDAGAPDSPAPSAGADAGAAGDDGAPHPGANEGSAPTAPLPADIVARSQLPFHGVSGGEIISARAVWRRLKQSLAICLGEQHDNPFHHNLQRRVLERLAALERRDPARRGELAVGYEMFQRPFQQPLDEYMRGALSEESFLEQTEYAARWGADLALYLPLFEANLAQGLPALALNAPTELTRQIGREGLESLPPELSALLPELDLDDTEHRQFIFGLFGLSVDDPAAASLENIYRAQVTWDETMAQTASEWLAGAEERRVLAFAGSAHCHESAIPRRLERRTGIDMLSVALVLESELEAFPGDYTGYELLIVLEE